jgi:hypothetical protein
MGVDQIVGIDRPAPDLRVEWAHERALMIRRALMRHLGMPAYGHASSVSESLNVFDLDNICLALPTSPVGVYDAYASS